MDVAAQVTVATNRMFDDVTYALTKRLQCGRNVFAGPFRIYEMQGVECGICCAKLELLKEGHKVFGRCWIFSGLVRCTGGGCRSE